MPHQTLASTDIAPLTIAGRTFRSRLILGTGKYRDLETMAAALAASGTEMVTVALRRANLDSQGRSSLIDGRPRASAAELPHPLASSLIRGRAASPVCELLRPPPS